MARSSTCDPALAHAPNPATQVAIAELAKSSELVWGFLRAGERAPFALVDQMGCCRHSESPSTSRARRRHAEETVLSSRSVRASHRSRYV